MDYSAKILFANKNQDKTILTLEVNDKDLLEKLKYWDSRAVDIRVRDNRRISIDQRNKIYATINDIALFTGDDKIYLKHYFKACFCEERDEENFSLSNCSVNTAKEFLNYILEFALKWEIPLSDLGINRTDDIEQYLYLCIKNRVCAISGELRADIHHCEGSRVGMGGNRNNINNSKRKLIALSREWHNKVHVLGEEEIFKLFKIKGIFVDSKTLREIGLKSEEIS